LASPFLLLLNFAEELLDTLVSLSLDCGVTLEELLESSQSSQTDEDESSSGRVVKPLLSSSPQAANKNADTAHIAKTLFIVFASLP
jgi:hypothetical protein